MSCEQARMSVLHLRQERRPGRLVWEMLFWKNSKGIMPGGLWSRFVRLLRIEYRLTRKFIIKSYFSICSVINLRQYLAPWQSVTQRKARSKEPVQQSSAQLSLKGVHTLKSTKAMLTATAAQYFAMPKMRRATSVAPVCTGIEIDNYLSWIGSGDGLLIFQLFLICDLKRMISQDIYIYI